MKQLRSLRPLALGVVALTSVTLLGACSDSAKADTTIQVTAGADSCALSSTEVAAGKVALEVTNDDSKVTEVYVYGADGKKVIGELENIGPGLTRSFTVGLEEGTYQVACKPGMKGSGIRTDLTVTP